VWGQLVLESVTRKERDRFAFDFAQRDGGRGGAERGFDLDLLDVVEERIETGASEDSDPRPVAHDADLSGFEVDEVDEVGELLESLDADEAEEVSEVDFVSFFLDPEPSLVEAPFFFPLSVE
jgi:ribosome assembly protein YihI (activator of Der GTPase)